MKKKLQALVDLVEEQRLCLTQRDVNGKLFSNTLEGELTEKNIYTNFFEEVKKLTEEGK